MNEHVRSDRTSQRHKNTSMFYVLCCKLDKPYLASAQAIVAVCEKREKEKIL